MALLASFWGSAAEVMGVELRPSDHLSRLGISWTLHFSVFASNVCFSKMSLTKSQLLASRGVHLPKACRDFGGPLLFEGSTPCIFPSMCIFSGPKNISSGLGPLWETSLVAFATLLDGFCHGFGSSTTGRGNDFLKMSLAVCLLLFNPCGRSWLRKSNCSVFFAVPSRVTLLASSGVVWAASCGASGVVLGLRWGGGDGRIASFRLALSSRYFVDPPFFCLSPSSDNIS